MFTQTIIRQALVGLPILISAALSLPIWIWAIAAMKIGILQTHESTFCIFLIPIVTLGFGNVILGDRWQLLSTRGVANGLFVFGLANTTLPIRALNQDPGFLQVTADSARLSSLEART